ncbi:MAG: BatA domain-containing protein [Planctomycetaceae bacterium]|nr:BatA domain-containing protein [Planctomycetaceae bacterium]
MPSFVHPGLLWGLGLLAVPVIIHLINLFRHRRVEWAAMEFLLVSQKKSRRWIILKQLLLLLLRMLAVAAVVFIVAQPLLNNQWGALLGGSKTHHIVLWDDSFSMSDHWADTTAFAEAKKVIRRIGSQAAAQGQGRSFSLIRFSRAALPADSKPADLLAVPLDGEFANRLSGVLDNLSVSETAAGPLAAIEAVARLFGAPEGENRVIYLISDFRAAQWQEPAELERRLAEWKPWGAQLHFVDCVSAARDNLAITALRPQPGTLAAGVELFLEVSVKNFGTNLVRELPVRLRQDDSQLPSLVVDQIAPGATETRRFPVNFPTAGQHRVVADLESDPVAIDNFRYAVLDLPLSVPVLIVDGAPQATDARFLALAMAPGGTVRTGIDPVVETPSYLSSKPLDKFQAIYLANIENLDQPAIDALENFARAGGGVAFFLGELSSSRFFNESLYRNGAGVFPLPLGNPLDLLVDRLNKTPDLDVSDHPIFSVFAGERNSFLGTVTVERYFSAARGWKPEADSPARIIARLRNGAPLVVERKFGEGKVVAVLTTAAPVWNNWGPNPSFVITLLELQAYLASPPRTTGDVHMVGVPWKLEVEAAAYQPRVEFRLPAGGPVTTPGAALSGERVTVDGTVSGAVLSATLTDTDVSGIYEAELTGVGGEAESRRLAVNVAAEEGALATVDASQLAASMPDVNFEFHAADSFQWTSRDVAGFSLSSGLLYLLAALLIVEQLLAYSASYHPPAREAAR